MRWIAAGLMSAALAGCGGKIAAGSPGETSGPMLTPVLEAVAWVNKMPGVVEKDASGKPIYPGRLLVKVYGDAQVIKISVANQSEQQLGQFASDQLVRRQMDKWVEYLVEKNLRLDEQDTLSVQVWMVIGEKDTVQSYLQNVAVKAVY